MIKYLVIRDFRGSPPVHCRNAEGYMGNKMLGTPAIKVQSIKNCKRLLRELHVDCPCSYFRRKNVQ